jgi:tetratricopeptide (TPR) repeat protein
LLQHIQPIRTLTDADRAIYGILYFQALDKNNKPLQPDSIINFSVNYYQAENDKVHLATAYYYKARLYKTAQQFDNATMLYLKALDLIPTNKNYLLRAKINSDLGDICSIQTDYKESLIKYKESNKWFQLAGDTINACYKIIDVGRVYRQMNQYAKAKENYKKALIQTNDSLLQGTAYQELGINFYWAKKIDSARFFLRKSLNYPYKGTNYAIRCSILADLYFDINQFDSALFYASKALKYPSTFFNQRDCYRILANTEYKKGDFKQMALFMAKYQDCSDSVRKVEIQTKTTVLEDIHQSNGTISRSKRFILILSFVLPIILIISIFLIYIIRKRGKSKEKELEIAEEKLVEKQVFLKESLIQKIEENKSLQAATLKNSTLMQKEKILKEIYNVCLHLNEWEIFKNLMNKTFNHLITTVETNYPELSKKEITWCCLFLLEIPLTEMTIIFDSQPGSLYKLKQRIATKMQLSSTKELELFLRHLSEK